MEELTRGDLIQLLNRFLPPVAGDPPWEKSPLSDEALVNILSLISLPSGEAKS